MRQHWICKSSFMGSHGSWLIFLLKCLTAFRAAPELGRNNLFDGHIGWEMYEGSFHHYLWAVGVGPCRPSFHLPGLVLSPSSSSGKEPVKKVKFLPGWMTQAIFRF